MATPPRAVLETILYAADVRACAAFYTRVLGFAVASEMDELAIALRVGPESVLLIFDPTQSEQAGRRVPPHGSRGPGHAGFLIDPSEYDVWLTRLRDLGVDIEHEHAWGARGRSIYFRDPAGNSVELITADIWR